MPVFAFGYQMDRVFASIFFLSVFFWGCGGGEETTRIQKKRSHPRDTMASGSEPEKAARDRTAGEKNKDGKLGDARPNFVLVLLDTLRPDYLGFYGFEYETAPFLAKLSAKSTVFENAFSTSSWTAPATASLFASLYPPQHGVVQGFRAHRGQVSRVKTQKDVELLLNTIPADSPTIPELFKRAGYRTFGFTTNINIGKEMGFSRGFDRFEKHVKAPAKMVYEKMQEWREDIVKETPFFLYLHLNDVHAPYVQHQSYYKRAKTRKGEAAARYRSEIGYLDEYLGKIWSIPGLSDNTIYIFVSDHGEEFWDHGSLGHGPTLYHELQHILFMVYGPDQGIVPARVLENVSLVDVLPTLVDLIQVDNVSENEGISLSPLLLNTKEKGALKERLKKRCLFGHRMYSSRRKLPLWSITCEKWKLIDWFGDRKKLFNHKTDLGEYYDVSSERVKMVERLLDRLQAFKTRMERNRRDTKKQEISLDEGLIDGLRALGYVE